MKDLKTIGQEAREKAMMDAVLVAYEKLKDDVSWQEKNRTGKLLTIAMELNTTHTSVAKYLAMAGIEY